MANAELRHAIDAIANVSFNTASPSELTTVSGFMERAVAEIRQREQAVSEREQRCHEREQAVQLREDNADAKLKALEALGRVSTVLEMKPLPASNERRPRVGFWRR